MFGIFRKMVDSDGTKMEGYYTSFAEYGIRREAYGFETFEEADEIRDLEDYRYHRNFPMDENEFEVVELD